MLRTSTWPSASLRPQWPQRISGAGGVGIVASHMRADFIQGAASGLGPVDIHSKVVADGLEAGVMGGNGGRLAVQPC